MSSPSSSQRPSVDEVKATERKLKTQLAALRNLAECFLMDEGFASKLNLAPAGTKNHHAYHGGLLEHVVWLMELAIRVAPCYPEINRDLLVMGAFLHDLGKTEELAFAHEFTYTDEGQLIGHLVLAVEMLDAKLAEAERLSGEPMPAETVLRLKHMILSHHGELAFGSPKVPLFAEAMLLHQLDDLDSKMECIRTLIELDRQVDGVWTGYNNVLDRPILKKLKYLEDGAEESTEEPPAAGAPPPSAPRTIEQLQLLVNAKRNL